MAENKWRFPWGYNHGLFVSEAFYVDCECFRGSAYTNSTTKKISDLNEPWDVVSQKQGIVTLSKTNSLHLKSYRNPIGKACLPITIFSGANC